MRHLKWIFLNQNRPLAKTKPILLSSMVAYEKLPESQFPTGMLFNLHSPMINRMTQLNTPLPMLIRTVRTALS